MKVIKALHMTAMDNKLLKAFSEAYDNGDIVEQGDGVFSKRISFSLWERDGDLLTIMRRQKVRDDSGRPRTDSTKIVVSIS